MKPTIKEVLLSHPVLPWSSFCSVEALTEQARRLGMDVDGLDPNEEVLSTLNNPLLALVDAVEYGRRSCCIGNSPEISQLVQKMGFNVTLYCKYQLNEHYRVWIDDTSHASCALLRRLKLRERRIKKRLPTTAFGKTPGLKTALAIFQVWALRSLLLDGRFSHAPPHRLHKRRINAYLCDGTLVRPAPFAFLSTEPETDRLFWAFDLNDATSHLVLPLR